MNGSSAMSLATTEEFTPAQAPDTLLWAGDYLVRHWAYAVPPFHREMYRLAESGDKRVAIAAPRSFAKSTVFSFIYPLYLICNAQEDGKIMLLSETGALAEQWLRMIKIELEENIAILGHYGDMKTDKWTQAHIICKRQVSKDKAVKIEVQAKGRGYQIRGFRPNWVICDDLESDEEVRSSDQREKTLDWFNKTLINALEKESQLIYIGTALHPLSLLMNVLERPGWTTRVYKALDPVGRSIWPEKWPTEALEARRKDIGDLAFKSEFMNEPVVSENPIFLKEWFEYYERESEAFEKQKRGGLYVVTAIDPAISRRDGADYSAIVTIGATYDVEPRIYILDVRRGHWSLRDTVAELFSVNDKYRQRRTVVETTAYQEALAQEIIAEQDNRHAHVGLIEVKPDKDKERRAHAVSPLLQNHQVYFDVSDRMSQKLMDELVIFPTGDHDDLVDALVYGLNEVKGWGGRKEAPIDLGITAYGS